MLDRASVVDEQFVNRVTQANFPPAISPTRLAQAGMDKKLRSNSLIHKLNHVYLTLLLVS